MTQESVSANRLELMRIGEAVAREKGIDNQVVVDAITEAIQKAAKERYGSENDIRAEVDMRTFEIKLTQLREVVEDVTSPSREVGLEEAREMNPAAILGDKISEELPPMNPSEFGRIAAQSAKRVIVQKVRDAERARQYEEYKGKIGEIVNGVVKRVEYGNVVVDLGRGEGVARREELLARERFREGDRIQAYIYDVRSDVRGPQIFLSRAHPDFMARLFAREVPEIYDGVVEIKGVARDPGSRAKIAVSSRDSAVDPVGACVGLRGSRVQAVVNELQGEKIDIVQYSEESGVFIAKALAPAEAGRIVLDREESRAEVVVPDDQLSLAIGRRGQNVKMAGQLTGWTIDVISETEDSERRQRLFEERTALFEEALGVEETVGQLLASEGFESMEDVAEAQLVELASVAGLKEETAQGLQERAREWLERRDEGLEVERRRLGVGDDLVEMGLLTASMLVALGRARVRGVEDLADLTSDDIAGWTEMVHGERKRHKGLLEGEGVGKEDAEFLVMQARVKMGWVNEEDLGEEFAGGEGGGDVDVEEGEEGVGESEEGAGESGESEVGSEKGDGEILEEAGSEKAG